jgi:glutathione S-transferase
MSVTFKYFDLSPLKIFGRGGAVRLFLLANNIPFKADDVPFDDKWPTVKAALVESGENPSGALPVMYDGDFQLSECNAISRYLARMANKLQDPHVEAVSDMMLDKVVPLRDSTINAFLSKEQSDKDKHKHDRVNHYKIIETLLAKHGTPSGLVSPSDTPTAGDASVLAAVYDDARIHGKVEGDYPSIKKLTDKLLNNEHIKDWMASHNYGDAPF